MFKKNSIIYRNIVMSIQVYLTLWKLLIIPNTRNTTLTNVTIIANHFGIGIHNLFIKLANDAIKTASAR